MIVRILDEGQVEVPAEHLAELNELDRTLTEAVTAGDAPRFAHTLTQLLDRVHALGTPVPADQLTGSDFILPGPDTDLAEVVALLGQDGLIPG